MHCQKAPKKVCMSIFNASLAIKPGKKTSRRTSESIRTQYFRVASFKMLTLSSRTAATPMHVPMMNITAVYGNHLIHLDRTK